MHLRHRSRSHRFAKFGKDGVPFGVEGGLDALDRELPRGRRHPVLQPLQFAGDPGADDIGTRGQKLAELHIGGTKAIDGAGKRRLARHAAARQQIGEDERRAGDGRQAARIDMPKRALARQHETGARQTREVAEGVQKRQVQSFQPEWMATTPPVRRT